MSHTIVHPLQNLDCYRAAKSFATCVHHARIDDAELRDHATRAAKSCFLNLAEGLPLDSKPMRRRFFSTARASLVESVAALDLALAIGAVSEDAAREALAVAAGLLAMLTRLGRA